jgi:hypothetical protein
MKTLKLGLIVECTPAGMESVVCPRILALLAAETGTRIEYRIETMVNKKLLMQDAGKTTQLLLADGFDRVVILWDENPPWGPEADFADDRCWHTEREHMLKELANPNIDPRVALVCVEREFETWLLHDHHLLSNVISTDAHPANVKRLKNPLGFESPKRALIRLFGKYKARYNADVAALKFARSLDSLDRLQTCDTFRLFARSILGTMPKGWQPYVYKRKGPKKK